MIPFVNSDMSLEANEVTPPVDVPQEDPALQKRLGLSTGYVSILGRDKFCEGDPKFLEERRVVLGINREEASALRTFLLNIRSVKDSSAKQSTTPASTRSLREALTNEFDDLARRVDQLTLSQAKRAVAIAIALNDTQR